MLINNETHQTKFSMYLQHSLSGFTKFSPLEIHTSIGYFRTISGGGGSIWGCFLFFFPFFTPFWEGLSWAESIGDFSVVLVWDFGSLDGLGSFLTENVVFIYDELLFIIMSVCRWRKLLQLTRNFQSHIYVSLQLNVQNALSAQPCVGKLGISLVLLNFLSCNCGLWLKTT